MRRLLVLIAAFVLAAVTVAPAAAHASEDGYGNCPKPCVKH